MNHLPKIKNFIQNQIDTYKQVNNITIQFGKNIDGSIFKTSCYEESEGKFAKLIRIFRNFKLSYSQGKIYKYDDKVLKTFNNKYNEIHKLYLLDSLDLSCSNFDIKITNDSMEKLNEFEPRKEYCEEEEYDEFNVHLTQGSDKQLLIFQRKGEYNLIKIVLNIELNLPYTYLDSLMDDLEKVLKILEEELCFD